MEIVRVCPTDAVMGLIEVGEEMWEGPRTEPALSQNDRAGSSIYRCGSCANQCAAARQEFYGSTGP